MMSNLGISNIYINNLMKKFNISFLGTYSSNNIPYISKNNVSIICNLSSFREKGSHFIAIYFFSDKILYFDPYGGKCYNKYISKYLKLYNNKVAYSNIQTKSFKSNYCGFYCISSVL